MLQFLDMRCPSVNTRDPVLYSYQMEGHDSTWEVGHMIEAGTSCI